MNSLLAVGGVLIFLCGLFQMLQAHAARRENLTTAFGALTLFGLGLLGASVLVKRPALPPRIETLTPSVTDAELRQAARIAARQSGEMAVRAVMLEPSSARFSSQLEVRAQGGFYVACGLVTGRNGFGGYAPAKRYLAIGNAASVEGIDYNAAFENDFRSYCLLPDAGR